MIREYLRKALQNLNEILKERLANQTPPKAPEHTHKHTSCKAKEQVTFPETSQEESKAKKEKEKKKKRKPKQKTHTNKPTNQRNPKPTTKIPQTKLGTIGHTGEDDNTCNLMKQQH